MCGICGFVNRNGAPADRGLLGRMKDAIVHRGPDGEGEFIEGGVALGHRRLSIIDVGGGGQPIANEDGRIKWSSMARFYNYVGALAKNSLRADTSFKPIPTQKSSSTPMKSGASTASAAGSTGCSRFSALWDARQREVFFIARDHLGNQAALLHRTGQAAALHVRNQGTARGSRVSARSRSELAGAVIHPALRAFAGHVVRPDQRSAASCSSWYSNGSVEQF